MKRIETFRSLALVLLAGLAPGLAFTTLVAEGQQAARIHRLGYITLGGASEGLQQLDSFRQGLRELGYVQGQNVFLEIRNADGKPEQLPDLAAELAPLKVDVIVTSSGTAALGAKKATQTIPIVMATSSDAVRQGLVASLARPGGNVTGLTNISPETSRKRLQILREMLQRASAFSGVVQIPRRANRNGQRRKRPPRSLGCNCRPSKPLVATTWRALSTQPRNNAFRQLSCSTAAASTKPQTRSSNYH